jgi:CubicO group peptidase (beta-lactamase class C family)
VVAYAYDDNDDYLSGALAAVEGVCDQRFDTVREVFAANLEEGLDVGASVAVVVDGELVVDLWGGSLDAAATKPWRADTITNVWSTTKTMTALCALILADRGELDFDAPVSRYWPEFAAAGKEAVEVRHLLAHTSGLAGWDEPLTDHHLYDWERCTSLLAAQAPWWSPGTASGYHAVTQGYLVGEVVRRITGSTLGAFFAEEVAGPLGADFHIGLDAGHDPRVAPVIPDGGDPFEGMDPNSLKWRTLTNPALPAQTSWEQAWRRAEIPAVNGHGNARSVATVQAVLACGGAANGVRLLSEQGCQAVFREQSNGVDLVLGTPLRLGVGYGLNSPEVPVSPNPRACFWGGWGGSMVLVDLDARLCVAYVMNRMNDGTAGDMRGAGLMRAAYASLLG